MMIAVETRHPDGDCSYIALADAHQLFHVAALPTTSTAVALSLFRTCRPCTAAEIAHFATYAPIETCGIWTHEPINARLPPRQ